MKQFALAFTVAVLATAPSEAQQPDQWPPP